MPTLLTKIAYGKTHLVKSMVHLDIHLFINSAVAYWVPTCLSWLYILGLWGLNGGSHLFVGFPGGPVVKNPPVNAGDAGDSGSIPELGRSPRGGNGNPLQNSCLENPMDRGAWWATVYGAHKELDMWACMYAHLVCKVLVYFEKSFLRKSIQA